MMKQEAIIRKSLLLIILIYSSSDHFWTVLAVARAHHDPSNKSSKRHDQCKAWLVQSIPTDMPHLPLVPGILSTADVFRWLAGNSSRKLDIMAQYWQLIANSSDSRSGDYGYSEADMQNFGADEGFGVYKAIENAADRNVSLRFLQHSGVYPDFTEEPSDLASGRLNVKSVTLLLSKWWGSGIIHAKVWISDSRDVYIGSANNDWKSLTQVKELGIYLVDCPTVAKAVEVYYDNVWKLASLNVSDYTRTTSDQQWQITRKDRRQKGSTCIEVAIYRNTDQAGFSLKRGYATRRERNENHEKTDPLEDFSGKRIAERLVPMDSTSFDDVLQNDKTHNPLKRHHETEDTTSSTLAKKDDPTDNELQMETQHQNMQLNEAPMHPEYKDHQIHALYQ
ncbi:hypothetical protein RJ639_030630 [Escallonia herrerae]|uniref:PLD phosphodiesterase domain-containing protein n=1 Tax=Escallonia herrerae TaxID=1293975 RepID=A0AA88X0J2_9ASTE|nr:hypothetical protein RJ639_030630 [Escallonia herrerae]